MPRSDGKVFENKVSRGFFGIGLFNPKDNRNVGAVLRTAQILGVDFVFTIGEERYKRARTDTTFTQKHMPIWHFKTFEEFIEHRPLSCDLVAVELHKDSRNLHNFVWPQRSIAIFGPEDGSIPEKYFQYCQYKVKLDGFPSYNLSVASGIVTYAWHSQKVKS